MIMLDKDRAAWMLAAGQPGQRGVWRGSKPLSGNDSGEAASQTRRGFSLRNRIKSFAYAGAGICRLVRREHNARVHLATSLGVVVAGIMLHIATADWRWLVLAMAMVWMAEAFNTAIEVLCDRICADRDPAIGAAKDLAAGAVLIAAIGAAVIGALTFLPYLV